MNIPRAEFDRMWSNFISPSYFLVSGEGEGGRAAYVGTEKIVGRGDQKNVTRWGVKIWLQGGGQLERTGRRYEGGTF